MYFCYVYYFFYLDIDFIHFVKKNKNFEFKHLQKRIQNENKNLEQKISKQRQNEALTRLTTITERVHHISTGCQHKI